MRHEFICARVRWPEDNGTERAGLPIDPKTLRRAFRTELQAGYAEANAYVANALFENATRHNNVAAQIFWLKNRAPDQWKDRTDHVHGGDATSPIVIRADQPEAEI